MVTLRKATVIDAGTISRVRAAGWQSAYRGIIADEYLDSMDVDGWAEGLRFAMAESLHGAVLYVAELETEIVGWAWGGRNRDAPTAYAGELYAIYLLPEYQRQGIGLQLTTTTAARLLEEGLRSMVVWALQDNRPARRFYEKLGGAYAGERRVTLDGVPLNEVAYGWKDLSLLASMSGG